MFMNCFSVSLKWVKWNEYWGIMDKQLVPGLNRGRLRMFINPCLGDHIVEEFSQGRNGCE